MDKDSHVSAREFYENDYQYDNISGLKFLSNDLFDPSALVEEEAPLSPGGCMNLNGLKQTDFSRDNLSF